ncbi:hypothetical protein E0Z10_g6926 [Xylaria hypoxylon]|uniref:PD-(D/E)XK nuclease-like domain-containing protein n=1 Tax=Xylaria hypoxylon TaxID=37992 RepID=A0A4Z0YRQ4_9PEZI|nr:hypothetical protein E0Z10_g6926 [Xylaria hypoxylon]
MVSQHNIRDWIDSIRPFISVPVPNDSQRLEEPPRQELLKRCHPPDPLLRGLENQDRQAKLRKTANCSFLVPHDMPSTPPQSSTDVSIRQIGQKRGSDQLNSDDDGKNPYADPTPKAPSRHGLGSSRVESPTKRPKLKSRGNLDRLEKPVYIKQLRAPVSEILPKDVLPLYKALKAAAQRQIGIVPYSMREKVAAVEEDLLDHTFRAEDISADAKLTAEMAHATLGDIVGAAAESAEYKRAEAGWNHHVHTPLLNHVFKSKRLDAQSQESVAARFEAMMGATITGDAIPLIRQPQSDEAYLACSVSLNTSVQDSASGNSQVNDVDRANPAETHSRSESKKVDYVLVMHINQTSALYKAIWGGTYESKLGYRYVNQTLQLGVLYSPIAVSIETKISSSREDPLIQLCLWIAAWHKRMYTLRQRLFPLSPQAYRLADAPPLQHPRLTTVLAVEVVAHEWSVHFACDRGDKIEIYGPVRIGSTATLLEAYALVACLENIRTWIELTFYEGIKAWFMPSL